MSSPYGTLPSSASHSQHHHHPPNSSSSSPSSADEFTGLMGNSNGKPFSSSSSSSKGPALTRLRNHFNVNISKSWSDLVLLSCYLITGLLDSSSVLIWGSFVSMQTGNTVYLGTGLANPLNSDRWVRAAISIASFIVGSFFFSRYHRLLSSRKRWVMVSATVLQFGLVLAAALLVTLGPEDQNPGKPVTSVWVAVPIALVAFQSAGQAVVSRVVKFNAYTSVVLTSIYCDLGSDEKLFDWKNAERNRRIAAPILLLVGAVIGGVWAESDAGMKGALWTAVGLKFGVILAWTFWAAEKDETD